MLAIAGGKGGCGKTTTALGVAQSLARLGRDPLVVDADCDMPDLHHVAGLERTPGVDELAGGAGLGAVVRESSAFPGVGLVAAGNRANVDAALARVAGWQGPVVVDCPPGAGPGSVRPLRHARAVLVVTTDEPASREDARRTVRAARRLDAEPIGVVVVRRTSQSAPSAVAGSRVIAGPPHVRTPAENARVTHCWHTVARQIDHHARSRGDAHSTEPVS